MEPQIRDGQPAYPPPTGPGWPTPFGPPPPPARRPSPWRRTLAVGAVAGLLASAVGAGLVLGRDLAPTQLTGDYPSITAEPPSGPSQQQPNQPNQPGQPQQQGGTAPTENSQAVDATAEQSVGLVQIASTLRGGESAGTGIIASSDGTVVTNHHVVEGATSIKVTVVSTGRTYTARYVGGDPTVDVAVIRLEDAQGLTPAPTSATPASVGDPVTAVGDAGGDGGSLTASTGSVTATGQNITVRGEGGDGPTRLTDLLQLRAYVVPGDSGGAVLDSEGRVVAMNVAASANASDVTGYAIPLARVQEVADQVLAGDDSGSVEIGYRGFLGVSLDPDASAAVVEMADQDGAADNAGIGRGDTITSVDGVSTPTTERLRAVVGATDAGDRVSVTWTTADGEDRSATVTLGEAPVA